MLYIYSFFVSWFNTDSIQLNFKMAKLKTWLQSYPSLNLCLYYSVRDSSWELRKERQLSYWMQKGWYWHRDTSKG